ncbi:glycosyltransferase family 4 protein [Paenibacillus sp. B01]|uniref:glycosyltransferase family 4 protein n=1 Tax=Paenibacillus sp. B01 TaxID=2660554 RepID=UPI001E4D299D|nr:glycosyltransferase family 4 protein [Paenibacillus sp. B01]
MGKSIFSFSPYKYYSNEQFMKDCCLIPYMFHECLGYRSVIVATKKEEPYPYPERLKGLEFHSFPDTGGDLSEWIRFCCDYISAHYEEMDVLFCFGAYPTHVPMVELFKRLRPDGKILLKLDANMDWIEKISLTDGEEKKLLSLADVITVESKKLKQHLSRKWPYVIEYVPNASVDFTPREEIHYKEKENIILTVGRIGSRQKATEILLEAFAEAAYAIPGWKLRLVGGIEDSFHAFIDQYFIRFPELKSRIVFTGKIVDKSALELEYKKAKVFVLSSILEGGTPNVWVESARNGCYTVCSNIDAVNEATNWGRSGTNFDWYDFVELSQILKKICNDEQALERSCYAIQHYRTMFFDYRKIVHKLHHLIELTKGTGTYSI